MKIIFSIIIGLGLGNGIFAQHCSSWVNPFIGSSNFGTTNPGAVVPQGMVSVVPFNVTGSKTNTWDKDNRWWSTPYSSDNSFFTGYSHVNLSGVGCPELGAIIVMPSTGDVTAKLKDYGSKMSNQKAYPGYYSCFLDKYNIKTEATATQRSGLSRFTFPKGQSNILIDLGNGLSNESGGYIKVVNDHEVEGWRMTGNFCYHVNSERPVYFVAKFSKNAEEFGAWKKMPKMKAEAAWSTTNNQINYYQSSTQPIAGDSIGAYFTFNTDDDEQVLVQLGISYVSIENARLNLETEQSGFDFEATLQEAQNSWETKLSKIKVEGGSDDQKSIFYTALYHLNIHPNVINDVNGQYPEMERYTIGKVSGNENRYTVFSLWDTYRNFHPLMSLLYPDLQLDFVKSILGMYKESGWLPKWELNGMETFTMNGDPAIQVITDSYLRGLTDFDIELAYEAMLKHATTQGKDNKIRPDHDFYLENGYMPLLEEFDNSTSVALEYYIADWNLGQLAKALGRTDDFKLFNQRSLGYKNYFDKEYKMIRPKLSDGSFLTPFNPLQGENFAPVPGFHEGTAWQYAFGVQHDMSGMIKLMGGNKKFTRALQNVFNDSLFDMANEPDMHYPFLFNYIKGEEWRSQKETHKLLNTYFKNTPDGLPGNDDCGTMSAWAIYAMMGLYPVCPGDMNYTITEPIFDRIIIQLDQEYYSGKELVIEKTITGDGNNSIHQINKDGMPLQSFFINHKDIVNGGVLKIMK